MLFEGHCMAWLFSGERGGEAALKRSGVQWVSGWLAWVRSMGHGVGRRATRGCQSHVGCQSAAVQYSVSACGIYRSGPGLSHVYRARAWPPCGGALTKHRCAIDPGASELPGCGCLSVLVAAGVCVTDGPPPRAIAALLACLLLACCLVLPHVRAGICPPCCSCRCMAHIVYTGRSADLFGGVGRATATRLLVHSSLFIQQQDSVMRKSWSSPCCSFGRVVAAC